MRRSRYVRHAFLIMLLALLVLVQFDWSATYAQSSGYAIDWYSIDGGGLTTATSTNGYALSGTIGQADAGAHVGSEFSLNGGFWGGIEALYPGYLPMVQK